MTAMAITAAEVPGSGGAALVERTEQMAALQRCRDDAVSGTGRFVLVRGEAGIGKTALVQTFVAQLPDASRVVQSRCEDLSTPSPFAPLREARSTLGASLGRLLDSDAPRVKVATTVLDEMSSGGFQVWLVEDLQWADDATLDLVGYLARRIDRTSALVIATYREEERPRSALSFVLGDLATASSVRHIQIPPLSAHGVATLAEGRHPDPVELHRLTDGNPFYVTEVLAGTSDSVPVSVRDAIRSRLSRLDERASRALQAAAILGTSSEPWLLAAVSGEDLQGIDDCLTAGLVRSESGRIEFRHELTRVTVLEDLPMFRGIGLHRRALEALRQAGASDDARLAYHAEGAADGAGVLRHGGAAASRSLAMYAHGDAAQQLRRCLRFAPARVDEARLDLLEKLGHALFMTGELEDADAMQSDAVDASRAIGDLTRLGRNTRRLARHRLFSRGAGEALPLALDALGLLKPLGPTRELALTYSAIGHIHMVAQRMDEVAKWSRKALELGRRLEDDEVMAYALTDLGSAELLSGRPAGRNKLVEALDIAKKARLTEHIDRALINLSETSLHNRELDRAAGWLVETAEFNAASQINLCDLHWMWAGVDFERGRWDQAVQSAETCLGRQKPTRGEKARAAIVLAAIAARRGAENAPAMVSAAEALASQGATPDLHIRWPLTALHAEAAWLAGDMAGIVDEVSMVYQHAIEVCDPWAIGDLGRWLWRAGVRVKIHPRAATPYALEVRGEWHAAMLEWQKLGVPYEAALCLADSTEPADMRAAHAELLALGATAAARRVGQAMRGLGAVAPRGPRQTTRDHPAGLTIREAEIAALAADGLTNREIADRLVLTEKTVGHHVSAVLGKLGVRRRADIGARLAATTAPAV